MMNFFVNEKNIILKETPPKKKKKLPIVPPKLSQIPQKKCQQSNPPSKED
jgi:hypothetical protein